MVRLSVIKSCPREGQFFMLKYGPTVGDQKLSTRGSVFMLKYGPTVGDQKLSTRGSVFYVEIWFNCR